MAHKFLFTIMAFMLSVVSTLQVSAQRQYLHEGWSFGQARLANRYPAQVPGVVHTDLLRLGLIDDPYIGLNERKVQWVDKEDWVYETTFRQTDAIAGQGHIDLCFDGLDTYADVYLNDSLVLRTDNMFRRWRVDVKALLKFGDNKLRVYLHSPIKVDMPKWEKLPNLYQAANDQSENGGVLDRKLSVFARKAGYHYGWDWGPRLVTSGIWRSVYLEAWSDVRIVSQHFRQQEVNHRLARLTDVVEVDADREIADAVLTITDEGSGRVIATKKLSLKKGVNTIPVPFTIRHPRLWWCKGLGKPELYTLSASLTVDGRHTVRKQERIGLRSVRLVMDPDADGHRQFYFVLNGVPVFAKGTNYIPQDNFLTNVTSAHYRQTLQDAVDANMNMIRVWGGGVYEDDLFYQLCDEMGLMVWQDFMFACSTYPAEGEWLENVRQEAADNIRRLRNHPSIMLWCGGNECMDAWYNWGWKGRMEKTNPEGARIVGDQQEKLYYDVLKEVVNRHIPEDIYVVGSPFSVRGKGSDGVNGDRHFYGVGHRRMPVSSYNQETAQFFSEYGMQSFPEYSTILKFAPDTATHDIASELMMSHQRGGTNANQTIDWYIKSEYGEPRNFREFLYASQLLQGDAMRTAIEAHRRRMPRCMGSLLWQHNDCWPVASWATRDYYGHWKAAHYMVRHAFEPLMCSAVRQGDSLHVYAVSDLQSQQRATLRITVYRLDGPCLKDMSKSVSIPANTSTLIDRLSLQQLLGGSQPEDVVISMSLQTTAGAVYQSNMFLCLQKDLRLQPVNPEFRVEAANGGCVITAKADKFVRALSLSVGDDSRFSNNYVDVLPGVPVRVMLHTSLTPDEVRRRLTYQCLNQIH